MRALSIPLLLALATPLAAQPADPAPLPGEDTALSLNAKVLAELQAQAVNRAAQAAQYKAAVAVTNQQTVEVQRIAEESEADYAARVAVWKAKTAEACKAGNTEACAKLAD
jgi:Tfp pilus assembly protein PilV